MAVCCVTQLVASTVVCSSEGSALILFKLRGVLTVYWTDCGLCIGLILNGYWTDYSRLERAQFVMWVIKLPKPKVQNSSSTNHSI
jgi:hypothetical protein